MFGLGFRKSNEKKQKPVTNKMFALLKKLPSHGILVGTIFGWLSRVELVTPIYCQIFSTSVC